jgi:hypothetical protein
MPGSVFNLSRRADRVQPWVVLEGVGVEGAEKFQGFCLVPTDELQDGTYLGDPERPAAFDFTQRQNELPSGLALYGYRVACPERVGAAGREVDLTLFAMVSFEAGCATCEEEKSAE